MLRRVLVVLFSIGISMTCLSGGYGAWQKDITIHGSITVLEPIVIIQQTYDEVDEVDKDEIEEPVMIIDPLEVDVTNEDPNKLSTQEEKVVDDEDTKDTEAILGNEYIEKSTSGVLDYTVRDDEDN